MAFHNPCALTHNTLVGIYFLVDSAMTVKYGLIIHDDTGVRNTYIICD